MYIAVVPNRNSPPAILLREGWREGNKTRQRTLANLSHWPPEKIETFRRFLRDEPLVSAQDLFTTRQTLPHGHVQAILQMIGKLELDRLLSAQPCRERDLVVAMIAQRELAIDPDQLNRAPPVWILGCEPVEDRSSPVRNNCREM